MDQHDETTQQALTYIRHQAHKGLADLRVLAERTAADCARCLAGISEAQALFKPGDEWSIKEVLDHLIYATAQVTIDRVRDLAAGKVPLPFVADDSYSRAMLPIRDLRQEIERLLQETIVLVGSLREKELPRSTWEHLSLGPLTLKELIALHRLHIMDHVQQIEKIKADPRYPTN